MAKNYLKHLMVLATFLVAGTAMAIDFPKVGQTLTDGGQYVLVSYVNPTNYFSRTDWDGAYYLLPYGDSNFAKHAFTAHQAADGTWYFSVTTTETWEEDGETFTEDVTSYMGFHEASNDNFNAKLFSPGYFKIEAAEGGLNRLRAAGDHGNPNVEGLCLHLNSGGQYLVISEPSCGWFPDVYGGVEYDVDDAGYSYVKVDDDGNCIPLDRSSELWAFANPDELPAWKNTLELYVLLTSFEQQMNGLEDATLKPGFEGGLSTALATYAKAPVGDEDFETVKALIQAKQALYAQILQAQETLETEPDAELQAAVDKAIVEFNTKNTADELAAAQAALTEAQKRHDLGQGDLTRLGQNMSFEDLSSQGGATTTSVAGAPTGWNLYVNGTQVVTEEEARAAGLTGWAGINGDGTGAKDGQMIYGIWNSGVPQIELSQTIDNLERGTYVVQAAVMVGANGNGSRRTTQRIFGNLNAQYFATADDYDAKYLDQQEAYGFEGLSEPNTDTELQEMTVRAFVYDGTLTFGFRTDGNILAAGRTAANGAGGDGWFKLDNFRIHSEGYVQDDALAVYDHFNAALGGLLYEQMQESVAQGVEALIDKYACDASSTPDAIVEAILALREAYPAVKSSVDAYSRLAVAIDEANEHLIEYSNYAGAGKFGDLLMEAQDMYNYAEADEAAIDEMIRKLDEGFQELKLSGVAVGIYVTNLMKNPGFEDLSAQDNMSSSGVVNPPAGWDLFLNGVQVTTGTEIMSGGVANWCGINQGDGIDVIDDEGNQHDHQYVEGDHLWGIWTADMPEVELSQTLTGIPAGTYVLSANVMVCWSWAGNNLTTQRLFANDCVQMFGYESDHAVNLPSDAVAAKTFDEANDFDLKKLTYADYLVENVTGSDNTQPSVLLRPMEVRFGVGEDGVAKIGFRTSNIGLSGEPEGNGHGWFKLDNFQLFYESEDVPTGIKGVSEQPAAVSQSIYSIDGRRQNGLQRGLNIVTTRTANSKTTTRKVIMK